MCTSDPKRNSEQSDSVPKSGNSLVATPLDGEWRECSDCNDRFTCDIAASVKSGLPQRGMFRSRRVPDCCLCQLPTTNLPPASLNCSLS